jgi:hypothetical protein
MWLSSWIHYLNILWQTYINILSYTEHISVEHGSEKSKYTSSFIKSRIMTSKFSLTPREMKILKWKLEDWWKNFITVFYLFLYYPRHPDVPSWLKGHQRLWVNDKFSSSEGSSWTFSHLSLQYIVEYFSIYSVPLFFGFEVNIRRQLALNILCFFTVGNGEKIKQRCHIGIRYCKYRWMQEWGV